MKTGKSKFASLRPPEVCLCSDRDQNVCCVYHENFELILQSLRTTSSDIPLGDELINAAVCSSRSDKCFLREYVECPEVDNVVEEHIMAKLIRDMHFTYVQWSKSLKKQWKQVI